MCVILSIHQKEKDPKIQLSLINKVISLERYNNDGVGIIAFNLRNDKWFYERKMELDVEKLQQVMLDYDIVNIHLRLATSGKETKENIHFWKKGSWFFAHNGTISGYNRSTHLDTREHSDSSLFFKELISLNYITDKGKVKYGKIKKLADDRSFWGRFVLINLKKKKIWYFGDFKASLLSNKVMVISTTDLDLSVYSVFCGLEFQNENKISIARTEVNGIFCIDIKTGKGKLIDEEFGSIYSSGYSGSGYNTQEETSIYKHRI